MKKNNNNQPDVHQFNHAQYWGYGLIIVFFTAIEYSQDWQSLKYFRHPSLEPNKLLFFLRSILFIEIIVLTFRWSIATINELDMWSNSGLNWSHWPNSPSSKQHAYAAMFGLAILLGTLLAVVDKILIFSFILSAYFLFGYWTQWLCNYHFHRAAKDTKAINVVHKERLAIMKHYWLKQPQLGRLNVMMFISMLSVSLATAASFETKEKSFYEDLAYALLILDILIGETIITLWRIKRDKDLEMNKE